MSDTPMRPVTVALLIQLLQKLPPEALVWGSTWNSNSPLDRSDILAIHGGSGPLYLYERDGEVRLYIDDGEATHPDTDKFSQSLFWGGEVWRRVEALQNP